MNVQYEAEKVGRIVALYRKREVVVTNVGSYNVYEEFNKKTRKWEETDEAAYVWIGVPNPRVGGMSTWRVSEEEAKAYLKSEGYEEDD